MIATVRSLPRIEAIAAPAVDFLHWLRAHRGAATIAGLLAFAGPVTFFTGVLSVTQAPASHLVQLAGWWTLYGACLWGALLVAGYACLRAALRLPRTARPALWLFAACVASGVANAAAAGRASLLLEHGLVYSVQTMHLYGFSFSLIMAMLYFAHLRRSREHEQAAVRLAVAQASQRHAQRRMVQDRLREVQARIDPQLLFDMLATVRRLYDSEPARAEAFLDELIVFLRAALPRLRSASSSLLREVELAAAFVRLRALAGAEGLVMTSEVAAEAMHARFPPGVLLPLLDGVVGSTPPCGLVAVRAGAACRATLSLAAAPSEAAVARVGSLLHALHGDAGSIEVDATGASADVTVTVPYELA